MTIYLQQEFVVEECCSKDCGITFAMTVDFQRRCLNDHERWFYCPNGHRMHYTGKTEQQKLREAQVRETALRDQLEASIREGEQARASHARDRQRIANGVCPCCSRSFENLRRHMASQHPEYAAPEAGRHAPFECGCGDSFETFRGLRVHQGHLRPDDWAKPGQPAWLSHLTVVSS